MTVYVDDAQHALGRMVMCHMMADTSNELHQMADALGVNRRHFQGDHYDVCKRSKAWAIKLGAIEVTQRQMVRFRQSIRRRRANG